MQEGGPALCINCALDNNTHAVHSKIQSVGALFGHRCSGIAVQSVITERTASARQVGRHCLELRSLSITAGTAAMTFANVTTLTALRYLNLSHSDGVAVAALRSLER